jgi:ssRNA-specific RNase YbeY (16S rRNA maturation enzyme)
MLHLAGFNDKTDEQKEKMRALENENIVLYRST